METADIILGLLTVVVLMLGWFLNRLADTVDKLEENLTNCQSNMPLSYVLKDDYKADIAEIKALLSDMYDIIRKQGKGE